MLVFSAKVIGMLCEKVLTSMTNWTEPTKSFKNLTMLLLFCSCRRFQPYFLLEAMISKSVRPVVKLVCSRTLGMGWSAPGPIVRTSGSGSFPSSSSRSAIRASKLSATGVRVSSSSFEMLSSFLPHVSLGGRLWSARLLVFVGSMESISRAKSAAGVCDISENSEYYECYVLDLKLIETSREERL